MAPQRSSSTMVPIRVDRLRAAQALDGRTWPEIARALKTTHQRLYHLSTGGETALRRCRQGLRDAFAEQLRVPPDWLSGETDALRWVLTADATVVDLARAGRRTETRVSMLRGGAGHAVPGLQLALDRLLARADVALARDFEAADWTAIDMQGCSRDQLHALGMYLLSVTVELGLDLVQPPPRVEDADAQRILGVRYVEAVLDPWLEGGGQYLEWRFIVSRFATQLEGGVTALYDVIMGKMLHVLVDVYAQLRGEDTP